MKDYEHIIFIEWDTAYHRFKKIERLPYTAKPKEWIFNNK